MPEFTAGPELIEHPLADDQVLEAGRQPVAVQVRLCGHAGAHVGVVLRQRHRRRADVARQVEELLRRDRGRDRSGRSDSRRCRRRSRRAPRAASRRGRAESARRAPSTAAAASRTATCRSPRRATSVLSISCASVSGCRPVSSSVAGGGGGSRLRDGGLGVRAIATRHLVISSQRERPLCGSKAMRWPMCRARSAQRADRQLEHASRSPPRQPDPPRPQVGDPIDHDAALVERDDVDRRTASTRCGRRGSARSTALRRARAPCGSAVRPRASPACRRRATRSATTAPVSTFLAISIDCTVSEPGLDPT